MSDRVSTVERLMRVMGLAGVRRGKTTVTTVSTTAINPASQPIAVSRADSSSRDAGTLTCSLSQLSGNFISAIPSEYHLSQRPCSI